MYDLRIVRGERADSPITRDREKTENGTADYWGENGGGGVPNIERVLRNAKRARFDVYDTYILFYKFFLCNKTSVEHVVYITVITTIISVALQRAFCII